jgi:hypothetical protein
VLVLLLGDSIKHQLQRISDDMSDRKDIWEKKWRVESTKVYVANDENFL